MSMCIRNNVSEAFFRGVLLYLGINYDIIIFSHSLRMLRHFP